MTTIYAFHQLNITHGFIHPSNIFKSDEKYLLGQLCVKPFLTLSPQTSPYNSKIRLSLSPETLASTQMNFSNDIWAIGVLGLSLMQLRYPFEDVQQIYDFFNGKRPIRPKQKKYSSALLKLIYKCLSQDYTVRPTIEQLIIDPLISNFIDERKKNKWL